MFKRKKKQEEIVEVTETKAVEEFTITTNVTEEEVQKEEPIERLDPSAFFDVSTKRKKKQKTEKVEKDSKEEPVEGYPKEDEFVHPENRVIDLRNEEMLVDVSDEILEEPEQVQEEISIVVGEETWQWTDNDDPIKQSKKEKKSQKKDKEEVVEKKQLATFFEEAKEVPKELKVKPPKKKSKKELKKEKKAAKKKPRKIPTDIKEQRAYRFKGKKYVKVEDFITYLNEHYLDIDDIAKELLDDEAFFGWVNKRSGLFAKSLKQFKQIQEKIEKNS